MGYIKTWCVANSSSYDWKKGGILIRPKWNILRSTMALISLSSSAITEGLQELTTDTTAVNSYAKWVLQLPDSVSQVSEFKDFPAHIATAKKHAKTWQTSVLPMIENVSKDIDVFSKSFKQKIDMLEQLLPPSGSSHTFSKDTFTAELNALLAGVRKVKDSGARVVSSVMQFSSDRQKDVRTFESDAEKVKAAKASTTEKLKALNSQMNAINQAIATDEGLIAAGVLLFWLAIAGGVDLKRQEDAKNDVNKQLANLSVEIATISSFQVLFSQLNASSGSVAAALSHIQTGWETVEAGIQEVIQKLAGISAEKAPAYLRPLLENASRDWSNVVNQSQIFVSNVKSIAPFA